MSRHTSELKSYSCGICNSPGCISHVLRRDGICPFEDSDHDWNAASMNEAVSDFLEKGRTSPMVYDISPCSEYTRFTMEGVLSDPMMPDKNAVFDPIGLGMSFMASRFDSRKWSEPLSYGMAVVDEDTRIHVQGKGKIIIRRALDRDHAVSLYSEITEMMRPSLIDSRSGLTVADTIRSISAGDIALEAEDTLRFLSWPFNEGDNIDNVKRALGKYEEERASDKEVIISEVRGFFMHGIDKKAPTAPETLYDALFERWKKSESNGYTSKGEALGTRTHYLMALKGISGIVDFMDGIKGMGEEREALMARAREIVLSDNPGSDAMEQLRISIIEGGRVLRHIWKYAFFIAT